MKQIRKILSLLMVLVLCVSLAPLSAFASEEPEELVSGEDALVPAEKVEPEEEIAGESEVLEEEPVEAPEYSPEEPEEISEEDEAPASDGTPNSEVSQIKIDGSIVFVEGDESLLKYYEDAEKFDSMEEAGVYLRQMYINRDENVRYIVFPIDADVSVLQNILNLKYQHALKHTGKGNEGDYLRTQCSSENSCNYALLSDNTIIYECKVFTSDKIRVMLMSIEQEEEIANAENELFKSLSLDNKTDYEKVKSIYDWVCNNVTYDHDNPDEYYLKFTPYSAIINKKTVCQGYATLLYRLLNDVGIDCRVITGWSYEELHAWNIVKIGKVYYNIDATWDKTYAQMGAEYLYFLKNEESFKDSHTRDGDCNSRKFMQKYPMAKNNYEAGVDEEPEIVETREGRCGESVFWEYDGSGILTITGSGQMYDYSYESLPDWSIYGDDLTTINIEDGVTSIGAYAFWGCNENTVNMADSITVIGEYAFSWNVYLVNVVFSDKLQIIEHNAFEMCTRLIEIDFPQSLSIIEYSAFMNTGKKHAFTIPNSVTKIGVAAFDFNLDELYIDMSIEEWLETDVEGAIGCDAISHVYYNGVEISDVKVPEDVSRIGIHFANNGSIERVSIPKSVNYIDEFAFTRCYNLQEVLFDDESGIQTIEYGTFYCCTRLENINLPDTIYLIEPWAFATCSSLVSVDLKNCEILAEYCFYGCTSLNSVLVSNKLTKIEQRAFGFCANLLEFTVPSTVIILEEGVFVSSGLTRIVLSNTTEIKDYAFFECENLTDIFIADTVKAIGNNVFSHSNNLTVYYSGTESQWSCITIGENNGSLLGATIHFDCDNIKYFVSYDPNGGAGAPEAQMKTYGIDLTLSDTAPTRTGYEFLGWATDKNATSATYSAGGSYTENADVTLYAVWKIKTYTPTPVPTATPTPVPTATPTPEPTATPTPVPAHTHKLVHTDAKSATCGDAGNIEYYSCSTCQKYFTDANAENEVSRTDVIIPATGAHQLSPVEAREATTTAIGNHAYYLCSVCQHAYKDAAGQTATTVAAESIARIMEIKVDNTKSGKAEVDTTTVNSALSDVTKEIGLAAATTESVKEALAASVSAENLEEISAAVAEALEEGKEVSVSMNVEQVSENDLSTEQKELLAQKIPDNTSTNTTSVVAAYLDLTVELKAEEETLGRVTQLTEKISFSVELTPAEVAALGNKTDTTNTNIFVARIHEGEVELIPATLNGNILTFETDQFSLFTVVTITYTRGDVNDDGEFDGKDLVRMMNYISGETGSVNAAATDANGDTRTDILDLVRMMKKLSGANVELN